MRAYVALGSNLGDRLAHLQRAVTQLAAHPNVRIHRASRLYETAPVGPPQGPYLNAVLAVETTLAPEELLALCQHIEAAGGRERHLRWGPRTIDLDILDVGGLVVETPTLRLPHPELARRLFVLVPLKDVAPTWRHPKTGKTVDQLTAPLRKDMNAIRAVADESQWCPRLLGMERA